MRRHRHRGQLRLVAHLGQEEGDQRRAEDAEALRARIILMGMPVEIQRAEVNGLQVNRVRVGPFAKIDDMNQTRTRLGQEKIPTAVVRQ